MPCITCGYDLRTLDASGDCPECGTAIARSLVDDHLHHADPEWLEVIVRGQRLIALGVTVLLYGCVISFLLMLVLSVISILLMMIWPTMPVLSSRLFFSIMFTIMGVCSVIGMILFIAGTFFITSRDPRESQREQPPTSAAMIARIGAVAAIVIPAMSEAVSSIPGLAPPPRIVSTGILLVAAFAFYAAVLALHKRHEALARRARDSGLVERIEKSFIRLRWLFPLFIVSMVISSSMNAGGGVRPKLNPGITLPLFLELFVSLIAFVSVWLVLFWLIRYEKMMKVGRAVFAACADGQHGGLQGE